MIRVELVILRIKCWSPADADKAEIAEKVLVGHVIDVAHRTATATRATAEARVVGQGRPTPRTQRKGRKRRGGGRGRSGSVGRSRSARKSSASVASSRRVADPAQRPRHRSNGAESASGRLRQNPHATRHPVRAARAEEMRKTRRTMRSTATSRGVPVASVALPRASAPCHNSKLGCSFVSGGGGRPRKRACKASESGRSAATSDRRKSRKSTPLPPRRRITRRLADSTEPEASADVPDVGPRTRIEEVRNRVDLLEERFDRRIRAVDHRLRDFRERADDLLRLLRRVEDGAEAVLVDLFELRLGDEWNPGGSGAGGG
ncbi:hypothetical protein FB451DRAFT_1178478 [Mycena latifolia]|nr:hypothetical protein FB451DRAFT_1178478 [Mycena latifolia]